MFETMDWGAIGTILAVFVSLLAILLELKQRRRQDQTYAMLNLLLPFYALVLKIITLIELMVSKGKKYNIDKDLNGE